MTKITHKIDNDAPLLPIENVTLTGMARHDADRFKAITVENRVLMNHIVKVYRTKGVVDSYNEHAGLRVSKLQKQIEEKEGYDTENLEMLIRLVKVVSSCFLEFFVYYVLRGLGLPCQILNFNHLSKIGHQMSLLEFINLKIHTSRHHFRNQIITQNNFYVTGNLKR